MCGIFFVLRLTWNGRTDTRLAARIPDAGDVRFHSWIRGTIHADNHKAAFVTKNIPMLGQVTHVLRAKKKPEDAFDISRLFFVTGNRFTSCVKPACTDVWLPFFARHKTRQQRKKPRAEHPQNCANLHT